MDRALRPKAALPRRKKNGSSDDLTKSQLSRGSLNSKPTCPDTQRYSGTSAFFVVRALHLRDGRALQRIGSKRHDGQDGRLPNLTSITFSLNARKAASTYHTKQLAQHVVMEIAKLSIVANEIEVS